MAASKVPEPAQSDAIGPDPRAEFARHVRQGSKPAAEWALGPELELIGYRADTLERIDPVTVDAVLAGFEAYGATPTFEDDRRIQATMEWGWVTVEPGGQIEFSGASRRALADVERDATRFLARLSEIAESLGILFVATGFDPIRGADEQRWYPKRRYAVMRPYFAIEGRRGWDMMCRTAAIQVNVDYASDADLAAKFVVGNRLGPVVAAMFANSPLEAGRLSGFASRRYAAWLETDRDRTGVAPAAIGERFTVERFVDSILDVPMLFVRRDAAYVDLAGQSFAAFVERGLDGVQPRRGDFADHLTTVFTEARLKQHVELRSADAGGLEDLLAAHAFWKGIVYDRAALEAAEALAPNLDASGFRRLQFEVARHGLGARLDGISVGDLARTAVEIAADGLRRVAPDESSYLEPLAERVRDGVSRSDLVVRDFEGSWGHDVRRAVAALRIA